MNLLLDTNIIIDYMGKKSPYYETAKQIVASGYFEEATLWMAAQSALDTFYVLSRYVDPIRLQKALIDLFKVVHVVALTSEDLVKAAKLEWHDMEDCLIQLSAMKCNADAIISRDAKGFSRSAVTCVTPESWLARMAEQGFFFDEISG